MSFFKVTLIRSSIGMPQKKVGVLKALGLRKRMRTVFHKITPATAGQLMKVKELIALSTTDQKMTRREMHEKRQPPPGFVVEKSKFLRSEESSSS
ncbi:39S ribosomal protein L33, mitochondrial [Arthrobotrys conoides]|uniref:Large ribosomal subunit protein uL30m n=1 Tax=Arthrobotrys conoides TaxID=74498 RepID=A0AAN8NLH8_9PEZI